ncbi:hypothetical protein KS4_21100 [Poriferisphaera corsica]|uniref:Uncharacterized protein n=1 Tax=Poriferisphaera corsica TaxID=2528020 RepID=A0A517YUW6_9BACT|nr:hypothetical protein KS4_21100 [Poriferisphaera corsica]
MNFLISHISTFIIPHFKPHIFLAINQNMRTNALKQNQSNKKPAALAAGSTTSHHLSVYILQISKNVYPRHPHTFSALLTLPCHSAFIISCGLRCMPLSIPPPHVLASVRSFLLFPATAAAKLNPTLFHARIHRGTIFGSQRL